ncbi:MAG: sugar phosphate isomerase/epimerase [Clostridiales bacterium]|nr:sugar phosphate isomerase/epimerase [Clostridiales bacterium]
MTNFVIGAQMYSVRDRCQNAGDMLAALGAIKAMGYNTCQLSGYNQDIAPEQVAGMLRASGVTCCATHVPFERMEDDFDRLVRQHKMWGCAYPGIGGLPAAYRGSEEGYREFARRANAISKKLLDHGMKFLYHNHAFEFYRFPGSRVSGMEILLNEAGEGFTFELDLFWVQAGGADPIDWIEKVAGRMDVVHLKEMNGSEKPPLMAPMGEGNMNWPRILAALDSIGVQYGLVEQDNAVEGDSLDCMARSRAYLAGIGGRF